jgi:hypothetical protein
LLSLMPEKAKGSHAFHGTAASTIPAKRLHVSDPKILLSREGKNGTTGLENVTGLGGSFNSTPTQCFYCARRVGQATVCVSASLVKVQARVELLCNN